MSYFLDTNICIYFLKGTYPGLLSKIMSFQPADIKIPAIVKAELLYAVEKSSKRDENLNKVSAFLMPFEIAAFGDLAAVHYGQIQVSLKKSGTPIGPNDLLTAATVIAEKGILVTNNIKEFSRIPGLSLENWTE